MAGSALTLDAGEIIGLRKAMMQAAANFLDMGNELLEEVGITETGEIRQRFEDKKDPNNRSWKDWSRITAAKKAEAGKDESSGPSILIESEALVRSIDFEVTPEGVTWGSIEPYANIHQMGGKAGRGRKVTIPARPYLGIGEDSRELIAETIEDFITRESGGLI